MNKQQAATQLLIELGLTNDEATLYLEALSKPGNHAQLSKRSGINRTKIYRLVDTLEKRGLIAKSYDDRGLFLTAADSASLEALLIKEEERLRKRRGAFVSLKNLLPDLEQPQKEFVAHFYEGFDGMKQMQWHELKTKGELLVLGNVTVEELVGDRGWSERFRALASGIGYKTKEIINQEYENLRFTECDAFIQLYEGRSIMSDRLPISTPIIIYNDTVSTYYLSGRDNFGIEVISKAYAETMRHIFEQYWVISSPVKMPE